MEFNKKLLKMDWKVMVVNITPSNQATILDLIDKTEVWLYFSGVWNQRKLMYFDSELSTQGVIMETNQASTTIAKFGASVNFTNGTILNDSQSTTNITKIKYR